ncbi:MAG: ATPase, T2SS/T4P/T4SS family, partial [Thermodesulfobacteriota bacterium]
DRETAEAVIQAALTGHLVLSTVHCGSAAEAVTRLLDLEVRPFLLASALTGVMCQRLVRKVCPECGQETTSAGRTIRAGRGCPDCRGTGYLGRTVLAEFLPNTAEISELIQQNADTRGLERAAAAAGRADLRQAGLRLLEDRVTDPREIERVLG